MPVVLLQTRGERKRQVHHVQAERRTHDQQRQQPVKSNGDDGVALAGEWGWSWVHYRGGVLTERPVIKTKIRVNQKLSIS
jgi:hypothetical protein